MNKIIKLHHGKRPGIRRLVIMVITVFAAGFGLNGNTLKAEGNITGKVIIIDGDTLKINGIRIRLHGIDAPEIRQSCRRNGVEYQCGMDAKVYLQQLINNHSVVCKPLKKDQYGRDIAKCVNYKNIDINAMMVSSGNAIAYLYYSQDYASYQAEARKKKRGIWAGRFTEPYYYRKANL